MALEEGASLQGVPSLQGNKQILWKLWGPYVVWMGGHQLQTCPEAEMLDSQERVGWGLQPGPCPHFHEAET